MASYKVCVVIALACAFVACSAENNDRGKRFVYPYGLGAAALPVATSYSLPIASAPAITNFAAPAIAAPAIASPAIAPVVSSIGAAPFVSSPIVSSPLVSSFGYSAGYGYGSAFLK